MHDHDLVELLDVALRVGDAQDDCWIDCQSPRGSILSYSVAGTVAKSIIGMANRDLQTAREWNDGVGYVVVGMEKGTAPGVREVPSEKLIEALRPYLGENAPDWRPRWVAFRGVNLLVIEVPAAEPGAAIYCLNREFDKETLASIYVRHPGRTVIATPEELARLTDRARGWALRGISAELGTGTAHGLDLSAGSMRAWLDRERGRLLQPVDNLPDKASAPIGAAVARLRNQRERLGRRSDVEDPRSATQSRTVADYRGEVSKYLAECRQGLEGATRMSARWLSPVSLRLVNATTEFWSQLVLTLQLPRQAWALPPGAGGNECPIEATELGLPKAPQSLSTTRTDMGTRMPGAARGSARSTPGAGITDGALREGEATQTHAVAFELTESGRVQFPASDLRPGATLEFGPLVLCTEGAGPLNVKWNVTGTVRGLITGTLAIPLGVRTWTPLDLIAPSRT